MIKIYCTREKKKNRICILQGETFHASSDGITYMVRNDGPEKRYISYYIDSYVSEEFPRPSGLLKE
jgi:hypothetical protein